MILLGLHHVDGIVMYGGEGAVPVNFGDYLVCSCRSSVHDHDIFRIDAAQTEFIGRIAFRCPVPSISNPVKNAFLLEIRKEFLQAFPSEIFPLFKWELERSAFYVVKQNEKVVGIGPAVLRRAGKKVIGILYDN
jgi:hypothetical protein